MRAMKDSGIAWVGQIPCDWNCGALLSQLRCKISDGPHETPTLVDKEDGIPFVSVDSINNTKNIDFSVVSKYISEELYQVYSKKTKLEKGDVLFTKAASIGKTAIVGSERFMVWSPLAILKVDFLKYDNVFLYYVLNCEGAIEYARKILGNETTQVNVGMRALEKTPVPIPPITEQQAIANFLDAKCATIDAAISRHKAIVEKLKEYRKAVIYQAVTKGLNPSERLVDRRSPIYGEMPEKWDLRRIKYLFSIKKEIAGEDGHTVLSITQKGIVPKDLSKNEGQIAESYANYQLVSPGDFAMNHMDLLTGWVDISKYSGVTSPDYRVFTLNDTNTNDARYFLYVFQMCYTNRIFYSLGAGVSGFGRWRLQAPAFLNFAVPVPPHYDQVSIADYLDDKCTKIDKAIAHNIAAISKLENYRKSIIYYAVTGKIDCRKEDNHAG